MSTTLACRVLFCGVTSGVAVMPAIPLSIKYPTLVRFWVSVNKNGPIHPIHGQCWEWTAYKCGGGYGQISIKGFKEYLTHRISWVISFGAIPLGLLVLHKCDNPSCVNPNHLFLGTYQDNMNDMIQKGRGHNGDKHWTRLHPERVLRGDANPSRTRPECLARGERNGSRLWPESRPRGSRHGMSKLTEEQVKEIRSIAALHRSKRRGDKTRLTQKDIAKLFKVSLALIEKIISREIWEHVK